MTSYLIIHPPYCHQQYQSWTLYYLLLLAGFVDDRINEELIMNLGLGIIMMLGCLGIGERNLRCLNN